MRPILIDTNAYTTFKLGESEIVEVLAWADRILVSTVVLGELLAGFATGTREARNREELARFLATARVQTVGVGPQTADSYALVYASLRRKGQPIPTNDLWIAATALETGAALLSRDAHFAQVDGLRWGRRLADFLP
jgi:predicted nucleic acid-binding protein